MVNTAKNKYFHRLIDKKIHEYLQDTPAILLQGPKWCGKTTTCLNVSASSLNLRDPDVYVRAEQMSYVTPSRLLKGEEPRLLDEWQLLPIIWDAVTYAADAENGRPGRFLLTGSATPSFLEEDKPKHTGTGRIVRLNMNTMSLEESLETSGDVSLSGLFASQSNIEAESIITVEGYADLIVRGGWPALISQNKNKSTVAKNYIESVCQSDLAESIGQAVDPIRAHALVRSLARVISQEASITTILADVQDSGTGMSEPTLRTYLNALRRIFVINEVGAWAPTLRSRTPLRSACVWHFCDPSLACAAIGANKKSLLNDLTTMGLMFESLCVRDLRAYLSAIDGNLFHYRDKSGLEIDAIAQLSDGKWAGIEIKLGGKKRIDEGAANLLALSKKVDFKKTGKPSFLMVLTGGSYAYRRPDGVYVVPLGCLKS